MKIISLEGLRRDPAGLIDRVEAGERLVHGLGKLPPPAPPAEYLPRQRDSHGIAALPIDEGAMTYLSGLPSLHRDPFDRLLIAQALQHGMTLVSVDPQVVAYPVPSLPSA